MLDSWIRNQSKPKKQIYIHIVLIKHIHIVLIKQRKKTVLQLATKKEEGKKETSCLSFVAIKLTIFIIIIFWNNR
jgi:hypothetical protein